MCRVNRLCTFFLARSGCIAAKNVVKWFPKGVTGLEKIRKHIIVRGQVQGVGFRWHIRHAATRFSVTGWVRNLYDGSVEMELEGLREDIDAVLESAGRASWAEITDIDSRVIPVQDDTDFAVRY